MFYLGRRQHDTWKANLILRWSPKELKLSDNLENFTPLLTVYLSIGSPQQVFKPIRQKSHDHNYVLF